MNERIKELAEQAGCCELRGLPSDWDAGDYVASPAAMKKFAELIVQDTHRKVISSILITDVIMEERSQVPTSEDYIRAINKDLELSNE
jgi:hypothetical protein